MLYEILYSCIIFLDLGSRIGRHEQVVICISGKLAAVSLNLV